MIFATNNEGKLRELKSIFGNKNIVSLNEKGIRIEVEEDQDSFYGNASKKAKELFKVVGLPVIADDSGLCINALNGFPGVYTHRFLRDGKTDEQINEAIINRCKNLKITSLLLSNDDLFPNPICYLKFDLPNPKPFETHFTNNKLCLEILNQPNRSRFRQVTIIILFFCLNMIS